MTKVQVYNEWDPLIEVIVGDISYARFPEEDKGFYLLQGLKPCDITPIIPEHVIRETKEDLDTFADQLRSLGIIVRRPQPINFPGKFRTLHWEADNYFCYCPRDLLFCTGDMIIETPSVFRSRYFETSAYRTLLHEYFLNGSRWIAAPKPELKDEIYDDSPEAKCRLKNIEIAFDAATCLRAGRDIFFSISETGNELGCRWLQSVIGNEYRVHACYNLNSRIHVDATISLLRPGLALLNPDRINEHNIPEPLKQWEVLWTPHMAEPKYSEMRQLSSRWLGMNLLMLSPDLAAVDCDQTELIKLLEKHQINVMPVRLRHARSLLGGVHCVTLDVCRKGNLESYFNI